MLRNRLPHSNALKFGLALATAAGIATVAAVYVSSRVMGAENVAFVQQSIGDTTSLLAVEAQESIASFIQQLTDDWGDKMTPLLAKHRLDRAEEKTTAPAALPIEAIDTDREVLDLALWRQSQKRLSNAIPERALVAMNARFEIPARELLRDVQGLEATERTLIGPAFSGRVVVVAESIGPAGTMGFIAAPLGHGSVDRVLASHVKLDRLKKGFNLNGMVWAALVDGNGRVLAQPSGAMQRGDLSTNPLFKMWSTKNLFNGQLYYQGEDGKGFYGGFNRIGLGQLAVLATVSEADAMNGVKVVRNQGFLLVALAILVFFGLGYSGYSRGWFSQLGSKSGPRRRGRARDAEAFPPSALASAKKIVAVLHGSVVGLSAMIEKTDPDEVARGLNDFFSLAHSRVKAYGGIFERQSDGSFFAIWGAPVYEGNEVWRALRCALDLRQDFAAFNGIRKVEGEKPMVFAMGIHSGTVLGSRFGVPGEASYGATGETLFCAASLGRIAGSSGADLLISHDVWQQSEGRFPGEARGEARLSSETGLSSYYSIFGYKDVQGREVLVSPPSSSSGAPAAELPTSQRWLVNNGSQIIGPLEPKQIAELLFAQELDFDCEVWSEGTGASAKIRSAGIFGGSEDGNASLWVYDGTTIHGPVSAGFVRTAFSHGAMTLPVWICVESTVQGWKKIETADSPVLAEILGEKDNAASVGAGSAQESSSQAA